MIGIFRISAGLVFGASLLFSHDAEARKNYNKSSAKKMCKQEMRADYRADSFSSVTVYSSKRGVQKVQGYAKRGKRKTGRFSCKVKNGRIAKLNFPGCSKSGGDDVGAAIAGALIGAAIVGATSKKHHHDYDYSVRTSSSFKNNWSHSYSPKPGVKCFSGQRACYKNGKGYNANWTQKEFG